MGSNFADRIHDEMQRRRTRLVVGLDPVWDSLPRSLREDAQSQTGIMETVSSEATVWALRAFCEDIIEATREIALAFKPQVAFFERFGSDGIEVLERILTEHQELLFIVDCKRGDIGSTSEAYAQAYFSHPAEPPAPLPCSAVTLNGYLGRDAIDPFLPYIRDDKGAFVLAKTSNPSSAEFQDRLLDGEPLYIRVARAVAEWGAECRGSGGFSSLGLVVGATFPEAARQVREAAPHSLILVPGIGVQGGKVEDAAAFTTAGGLGAIFNFSRGVIYAYKGEAYKQQFGERDWALAARAAAEDFRQALNDALD
jgi:orotidine-5'-phosphate decarboxylase